MTKKKQSVKSKKAVAGKSAKGMAEMLTVQRGGEDFPIEKAGDVFAVKKRPRTKTGELALVAQRPTDFPELHFLTTDSTRDVEVYQVQADSLDTAMTELRKQSPDIYWCSHVYHMEGDPKGLMVPGDSIYVEFKEDADTDAVNHLLSKHHLEIAEAADEVDNAFVVRLTSASKANPIRIANSLAASKHVRLAEPDFSVRASLAAYSPADSLFPMQWHLQNTGGFGLKAGADVSAPQAWDISRGDRSKVVCIMDDGVQTSHPEFSSPGKVVEPYDFGENDTDAAPVLSNDNHGTACAGVAVADENGDGVMGIAPNCALMPIRTSGMISDQSIKDLFDYARTHGADIISCSWGVAAKFFTLSTRMKNAIKRAATEGRNGLGCVILFAAGNEDSPVDGIKDGSRVRSGFAIHPDVIAISASNSRDERSHYSNYGPDIWVCAPSSGAGGRGIVTTDRTGGAGYQEGAYTTVERFGGTSSSTPLVAGICGLILSVNADLTSEEVKDILRKSAEKIDQENGNYNAEGHSEWYGWGRVNAFRALDEARQRQVSLPTRIVSFERSPALPIPDNRATGTNDLIHVDNASPVRSVAVALEITHSYRGDLRVELIAPSGHTVPLHNRQGGSRDDLIANYNLENTPSLAGFSGEAARGEWALRVSDLANADLGTLVSWKLILELDGSPSTEWETTPGLIISDNDPQGIVSDLAVDGSGRLTNIELTVDINHTWRGDLRVQLETPGGLFAQIHNLGGGSADNLKQSYRAGDTPSLQSLVDAGTEISGVWRLHVADHARADVGKLNAWKLTLH
ncbi:MAG: S8 family serine peptidase [Gammaproteobacteria bacterium]|nr:S8 family serine peptidase [Gammaproteobacteria bacterium]